MAFVIWMVGYPAAQAYANYMTFKKRGRFDDGVYGLAALIELATWIYVGTLLYEA